MLSSYAIGPISLVCTIALCWVFILSNFEGNPVMSTTKHHTPKSPEEHPSSDERLDEALDETFPASDPIAVDPDEDDEDGHQGKHKKSR
ncbi:conserved hypothetical protein [Paraburkholderia phymatum STM815]|uniref:Transmembrane protein n=2 Tax=Paraburkholderia phymatum TaxID=148447 RepID=B2JKR8_PARP8|nr:conserved hypothetical protein [Paraburkholderia phymatum STM815]